jgi:hypothetical protein
MHLKRKKEKKVGKEERKGGGGSWNLESVASPSLSNHDETRLDSFQGHTGSPAKPHEPGVYDSDEARDLLCARGPHIPHACGWIHCDLYRFLGAVIRCTITLVPPLIAASLLCVRPTWALITILACGTISSMSGIHNTRMQS